MSNIIDFNKRITAASRRSAAFRSDRNCLKTINKIARQYAAVPAWITRNPVLNRQLIELQNSGWKLTIGRNTILCRHPGAAKNQWMDIFDAHRYQRMMEGGSAA